MLSILELNHQINEHHKYHEKFKQAVSELGRMAAKNERLTQENIRLREEVNVIMMEESKLMEAKRRVDDENKTYVEMLEGLFNF